MSARTPWSAPSRLAVAALLPFVVAIGLVVTSTGDQGSTRTPHMLAGWPLVVVITLALTSAAAVGASRMFTLPRLAQRQVVAIRRIGITASAGLIIIDLVLFAGPFLNPTDQVSLGMSDVIHVAALHLLAGASALVPWIVGFAITRRSASERTRLFAVAGACVLAYVVLASSAGLFYAARYPASHCPRCVDVPSAF